MGIALVSSLKQQDITDTVVHASSLVHFLLLAEDIAATAFGGSAHCRIPGVKITDSDLLAS
jgi:hypothetical protein